MDRGRRDKDRRDGPPDLVIGFSKVSPDTWPPVAASVSCGVTRTRLWSRWTEPLRNVADAELLANLAGVDSLPLPGEGRVSRDDKKAVDARQIIGEVPGDPVDEIVLGRIIRMIGEGEDHDREVGNRLGWVSGHRLFGDRRGGPRSAR